MSCVSARGSFPGAAIGFTVSCSGTDPSGTASSGVQAVYLTLSDVVTVTAIVNPIPYDGTISDPAIVARVLIPTAALVAGEEGSHWLQAHLSDQACTEGCFTTIASVKFELELGVDGSASLNVTPASMQ